MASKEAPIYLSAAQLSERWAGTISKVTLDRWRSEGKGPTFVKLGGSVAYKLSDVEAYEAERTRQSTRGATR